MLCVCICVAAVPDAGYGWRKRKRFQDIALKEKNPPLPPPSFLHSQQGLFSSKGEKMRNSWRQFSFLFYLLYFLQETRIQFRFIWYTHRERKTQTGRKGYKKWLNFLSLFRYTFFSVEKRHVRSCPQIASYWTRVHPKCVWTEPTLNVTPHTWKESRRRLFVCLFLLLF